MPCFNNEWTLITSATSGIGLEMARLLASRGLNLILAGPDEENLYRLARELNEVSDIIVMTLDLNVPGSANLLFNECEKSGIRVSAFINNPEPSQS